MSRMPVDASRYHFTFSPQLPLYSPVPGTNSTGSIVDVGAPDV